MPMTTCRPRMRPHRRHHPRRCRSSRITRRGLSFARRFRCCRSICRSSAPGPYGQSFGLRLATEDLVGNHSLSIGVSINSGRADATGVFGATPTTACGTSLYIDFHGRCIPRGGIRVNGGLPATYDEEAITGAMGTSLPILRDVARSATLSFSYSFSNWRNMSPPRIPGPR